MHSQMCISSGNFQKKCIFREDILQASKLGRGRELTKDRPYIHIYIGLCEFCHMVFKQAASALETAKVAR